MAHKARRIPKSCFECRKIPRKDAIIFNCYKCTKSYHNVCRLMTEVHESSSNGTITLHMCDLCKAPEGNTSGSSSSNSSSSNGSNSSSNGNNNKALDKPSSPCDSTPAGPVVVGKKALVTTTRATDNKTTVTRMNNNSSNSGSSDSSNNRSNNGGSNSNNSIAFKKPEPKAKDVSNSGALRLRLPHLSLRTSTPARPAVVKKKVLVTTRQATDDKSAVLRNKNNSSNNSSKNSNDSSRNSSNNSSNDSSDSVDSVDSGDSGNSGKDGDSNKNNADQGNLMRDEEDGEQPKLPRSRTSTFTLSPLRLVDARSPSLPAGHHVRPSCSSLLGHTTTQSSPASNTSRLESSVLRNGTVISSLVAYANSVRDTVEGAISSQRVSIESKLGEIAGFLSVLPKLTEKIGSLESKVDSLEARLVERNIEVRVIEKECEQLRKIISDQTAAFDAKIVALEGIAALASSDGSKFGDARSEQRRPLGPSAAASSPSGGFVSSPSCADPLSERVGDGFYMRQRRRRTGSPRLSGAGDIDGRNVHGSPAAGLGRGEAGVELIISKIYDGPDEQTLDVVHAILATVHPAIERDDIKSVRPLQSGGRHDSRSPAKELDCRRPKWLVCLSRRELTATIMRAKGRFTALNTKRINVSHLNEETSNSLINSKIFINEFLHKECFARFNNLKQIARGLDFKYIWHRGGRFLVKMRDGEQSHVFTTAEDLHALANSFKNCKSGGDNIETEEDVAIAVTGLKAATCASGQIDNSQD